MDGYCQDMQVASYLYDTIATKIICDECFKIVTNYFDDDGQICNREKHSYRFEYKIFKHHEIVQVKKIKRFISEKILQYYVILNKMDTMWVGGTEVPLNKKLGEGKYSTDSDSITWPTFQGGNVGLVNYMQSNVRYPKLALANGIFGVVFVNFTIDKEGYIDDVMVVKEMDGGLTEEAARAIINMPKWTAGYKYGKLLKTEFTYPVKFKL